MKMNKHNFIGRSQNYLKFFMKLKPIKILTVDCYEVEEIEILYSVLFHILERHSFSIEALKIRLNTLIINDESDMFIDKMFGIPKLSELHLSIEDCRMGQNKNKKNWQEGINSLNELRVLNLKLPSLNFPHLNLKKLEHLAISFSE